MRSIYPGRLAHLRRAMKQRGLAAVYLTSTVSRRYITGFTGTSGTVLITPHLAEFFTDFRYLERAAEETLGLFKIIDVGNDGLKVLSQILKDNHVRRLGFEDRAISVARHKSLQKQLKPCSLVGIGDMVEKLRAVKDDYELDTLRRAVGATDKTFQELIRWLKHLKRIKRLPSEEAAAWKVRDIIHSKKFGEISFEPIIASGANAARPHHEPSPKKLKLAEMVIIDLGVKVNGYHADMTRTIFLGEPTTKQRKIYETTLSSQLSAISYLKKGGRSAKQADMQARRIIDAKFPGAFGHALGHGVGLEIHERPKLAQNSDDILKSNMVFSIEPGIYLPGEGGVRIEDLVVLKESGSEVISKSPKILRQTII